MQILDKTQDYPGYTFNSRDYAEKFIEKYKKYEVLTLVSERMSGEIVSKVEYDLHDAGALTKIVMDHGNAQLYLNYGNEKSFSTLSMYQPVVQCSTLTVQSGNSPKYDWELISDLAYLMKYTLIIISVAQMNEERLVAFKAHGFVDLLGFTNRRTNNYITYMYKQLICP